jgi:hypothetical protein
MIRPPLPRVKNGDVLGLGLMNGIINRIEYAADLLRQGRPLAGESINIEENYSGTIISYNPIEQRGEVLCGYYQKSQAEGIIGFVYRNGVFIDLPSPSIGGTFDDSYFGISENRVCGSITAGYPETYGFIYSDSGYAYYRFQGDKYTEFFSIRKNQVVGYTDVYPDLEPLEQQRGLYFNTSTGQQTSSIFPYSSFGIDGFRTVFQDIYENKIVGDYSYLKPGGQAVSVGTFIYENNSWQQANYPDSYLSSSFTIYGDKIFGYYKNSQFDSSKIYMNQNGQFTTNQLLTDISAGFLKLKNSRLAGTMIDPDDGIRKGFVYDIDSGQLTKIQHPLATITGTYVTGID